MSETITGNFEAVELKVEGDFQFAQPGPAGPPGADGQDGQDGQGVENLTDSTLTLTGADDGAGNYTRSTLTHDAGGDLTIATEAGGTGVAGDVNIPKKLILGGSGISYPLTFLSSADPSYTMELKCDGNGDLTFTPDSGASGVVIRHNDLLDVFGGYQYSARNGSFYSMRLVSGAEDVIRLSNDSRISWSTTNQAFQTRDTALSRIGPGIVGIGDNSSSTDVSGTLQCATVRYSADTFVTESTMARTLTDSDWGKVILCTNASGCTVTVPSGLSPYFFVIIKNKAAGTVSLDDDSGATTLETALAATEAAEHEQLTVANLGTTDTYEVQ